MSNGTQISRQELRQGNLDWEGLINAVRGVTRQETEKTESKQFEDIMANLTKVAGEKAGKSGFGGGFVSLLTSGFGWPVKLASYLVQGLIKKKATEDAPKVFDKYIAGLSGDKKEAAQAVRKQYKDAVDKGVLQTMGTSAILDQIMPWANESLEGLDFKGKLDKINPFAKGENINMVPGAPVGKTPLEEVGKASISLKDAQGLQQDVLQYGPQYSMRPEVSMVNDPSKGLKNLFPTGVDAATTENYLQGLLKNDKFKLGEGMEKMLPFISLLLRRGLQ